MIYVINSPIINLEHWSEPLLSERSLADISFQSIRRVFFLPAQTEQTSIPKHHKTHIQSRDVIDLYETIKCILKISTYLHKKSTFIA